MEISTGFKIYTRRLWKLNNDESLTFNNFCDTEHGRTFTPDGKRLAVEISLSVLTIGIQTPNLTHAR